MKIHLLNLVPYLLLVFSSSTLFFSCSKDSAPDASIPMKDMKDPESAYDKKLKGYFHTIYFDFDRYNIRRDQIERADHSVKMLNDDKSAIIQIQGHCDDRGSVEYNNALGNKRAQALKRYFVNKGIDASRIKTATFGKENPAVKCGPMFDHMCTELEHAQNRRDEIVVKKNN